jgi:hypothetical protein
MLYVYQIRKVLRLGHFQKKRTVAYPQGFHILPKPHNIKLYHESSAVTLVVLLLSLWTIGTCAGTLSSTIWSKGDS